MLKLLPIFIGFGAIASACSVVPKHPTCPVRTVTSMPRVPKEAQRLEFWLEHRPEDLDRILLSATDIRALNRRNGQRPWAFQDVTSDEIADRERIAKELLERQQWVQDRIESGLYKDHESRVMKGTERVLSEAHPSDELRVLIRRTDLRCLPSKYAMHSVKSSPTFDRNQCSGLAPGHLVRVLLRAGAWSYVHAAHSVGWVFDPQWTPPLSPESAREFRDSTPRLVFTARSSSHPSSSQLESLPARELGESYPLLKGNGARPEETTYLKPTVTGLVEHTARKLEAAERGWLPFTRRNVLRLAFGEMERGYGWGETEGLTDCSRLLLDTFRAFGLSLGRHSSEQARSGTSIIDSSKVPAQIKRDLIRKAAVQGIVLLYMPGHIMLYLGAHQGRDYALSAIYDYPSLCRGTDGENRTHLGRVAVSDLSVGEGTRGGTFLERTSRIAVFGAGPNSISENIEKYSAPSID